jgi:hypothetical protein
MRLQTRIDKLEQAANGRDGQGCDLCARFPASVSGDEFGYGVGSHISL